MASNKDNEQAAIDELDAIRERFEEEFKPVERFAITGSGLVLSARTIRVYVLTEAAKNELTAELQRRDSSHGCLCFEGTKIVIVVTGRIVACSD